MTELITRILNFFGQFKLLVMILPWERAARIRLGSCVKLWDPGWHIKLPFVDEIVLLNTRLRVSDALSQTLTTADGHPLTVGMTVGFRITDPLAALMRMHHPETTISALAASATSGIVSTSVKNALSVAALESHVRSVLVRETPYEVDFVRVKNYAFVRTYRLLNDPGYSTSVSIEERKL